jgi:hypothetical protein
MKMKVVTRQNEKQYLYFLILILLSVIICNESFTQSSAVRSKIVASKTGKQMSKVRLKTTITPRRSEVAFLKKAMEVIVTPFDEFNNEIDSLAEGLPFKLYSNSSEDIKEANFNANRTINGKYYTYITPMRVHDIKNNNELEIGAFLLGSDGLPDLTTGSFAKILVVNHIPIKPDTSTFKIYDCQSMVYLTNLIIQLFFTTDKYIFSWGCAPDSNDKPLIKSIFSPGRLQYPINDSCVVKYTFRIKEYDISPFPIYTDTSRQVILTASQLVKIMIYIKGSSPTTSKLVFFHWYVTFEDDVYNYTQLVYRNELATDYKTAMMMEFYRPEVNPQYSKRKISLQQNYPNPFNPSTNITFYLPEKCYVNLKVYDGIGREVNTLVNKTMPMGEHSVNFDAKALPAGAYFYRLQAGNYSEIKRMLFLK